MAAALGLPNRVDAVLQGAAPSAATISVPTRSATRYPKKSRPCARQLASSMAMKVLPAPDWPPRMPTPVAGSSGFTMYRGGAGGVSPSKTNPLARNSSRDGMGGGSAARAPASPEACAAPGRMSGEASTRCHRASMVPPPSSIQSVTSSPSPRSRSPRPAPVPRHRPGRRACGEYPRRRRNRCPAGSPRHARPAAPRIRRGHRRRFRK